MKTKLVLLASQLLWLSACADPTQTQTVDTGYGSVSADVDDSAGQGDGTSARDLLGDTAQAVDAPGPEAEPGGDGSNDGTAAWGDVAEQDANDLGDVSAFDDLHNHADGMNVDAEGDASDTHEDTAVNSDAAADTSDKALVGPTCFGEIYDPEVPGPDYDQFDPSIASHCLGTDEQDITGIEQIVFLGDSVTVGTPNLEHPLSTDNSHFWRNKFAEWAATQFGLSTGNAIEWGLWKAYDYVSGKGGVQSAGAFRNCSEWGARTDDLLAGDGQIPACFPDGGSDKKTLIVFTIGGNDINAITEKGGEATAQEVADNYPKAWEMALSTIDYLTEALAWLTDPARFPAGSYVVFASPFEFTDGTGDVSACPVAGLTGLQDWEKPEQLQDIVSWVLEQYQATAIQHHVDLVWMLEHFCGHGYVATGPLADPANRCYRGPDTPIWFDETCIHPNEAGHAAIFEMFKAVVLE